MPTPNEMIRRISTAMQVLERAVAGTNSTTVSQKLTSLESELRVGGSVLGAQCAQTPNAEGCPGLLLTIQGAAPLITRAQQRIIALTTTAPPAQQPPPAPGSGGGGGGGGGLPVPTPPPGTELPTTWDQLFGGDAPWYQRPGYLIGGALVLGGLAVVLSLSSSKKRTAPKAEEE